MYAYQLRADAVSADLAPRPRAAGIRAVEAIELRLRLEETQGRRGVLDGAWWPRSRDVLAELPQVITALTQRFGTIPRIGLNAPEWDAAPRRITTDGRLTKLGWFNRRDHLMFVSGGSGDYHILLVVPPDTDRAVAANAMTAASRTGNSQQPDQLLDADSAANQGR
jgi:Family of unknown function (DUF5994)